MNNITQCTRKLDYVSGVSAFRVRLDSPVSRNIERSIHKLIYRYNILLTILFPWGCEHRTNIFWGVKLNIYFHTKRRTWKVLFYGNGDLVGELAVRMRTQPANEKNVDFGIALLTFMLFDVGLFADWTGIVDLHQYSEYDFSQNNQNIQHIAWLRLFMYAIFSSSIDIFCL